MNTSSRALAGALAALTLLASGLRAQNEIFERGNQLYQEEDFLGAIEAYEAVRSAGFEGADLHYNLGNAYFKAGNLGRSILEWERALALAPGDEDVLANLELARSLTADAIEPLPRFWLLGAISWWVQWLPRGVLVLLVGGAWLAAAAGVIARIWARRPEVQWFASWLAIVGAAVVVVFGTTLIVRELEIGRSERAVILVDVVPVRAAPAEDDDLTLFEIHEGAAVRIEQRTGEWAEVVLDDGKVGWVPNQAYDTI
jgi:tetratricopeptide (TPR) repeat protein